MKLTSPSRLGRSEATPETRVEEGNLGEGLQGPNHINHVRRPDERSEESATGQGGAERRRRVLIFLQTANCYLQHEIQKNQNFV